MRGARLWPMLLVSLTAQAVEAPAPACRNDPDGRVSCTAEGFRTLTTAVVVAQTDQRVCLASLDSTGRELKRVRGELTSCESRPAPVVVAPPETASLAAPPAVPEPDRRRVLLGLVVGLVSSALATAAVVAPGLPGELRIGLGALGAAGATASAVIVAW